MEDTNLPVTRLLLDRLTQVVTEALVDQNENPTDCHENYYRVSRETLLDAAEAVHQAITTLRRP